MVLDSDPTAMLFAVSIISVLEKTTCAPPFSAMFAEICSMYGRTETQLERLCQSEQSAWVTAA